MKPFLKRLESGLDEPTNDRRGSPFNGDTGGNADLACVAAFSSKGQSVRLRQNASECKSTEHIQSIRKSMKSKDAETDTKRRREAYRFATISARGLAYAHQLNRSCYEMRGGRLPVPGAVRKGSLSAHNILDLK